jgi:tetratricopeptide (TPR) repeat protein
MPAPRALTVAPAAAPASLQPTQRAAEGAKDAKASLFALADSFRVDGNEALTRGDAAAAVKAYSRALALVEPRIVAEEQRAARAARGGAAAEGPASDGAAGESPEATLAALRALALTAYANRAQAHLRLKEWRLADADATEALRRDARHGKSWFRRALARGALGRHEAAARDLAVLVALEPSNRTALVEERKAVEAVKACSRRLPAVEIAVRREGGEGGEAGAAGAAGGAEAE